MMYRKRLLFFLLIILSACQSQPGFEITLDPFDGYGIPEYFKEQVLEKEARINDILSMSQNVASFIFFTDAHWEINSKHSPEIIRHVQNSTGLNYVFFGGDAISGSLDKAKALSDASDFSQVFYRFRNFYSVIGNHDYNKTTANINSPDTWFSDEEVYSYLYGRLQTYNNVCYGGDFYYYVDDSIEEVRYLCLDTGNYSFPTKERDFIAKALTSCPCGWHVVIITHIVLNAKSWYDPKTVYIPDSIKLWLQIADAFNERRQYQADEQSVYDFSNATGRVDLIIGGHIHRDFVDYSEGGIP